MRGSTLSLNGGDGICVGSGIVVVASDFVVLERWGGLAMGTLKIQIIHSKLNDFLNTFIETIIPRKMAMAYWSSLLLGRYPDSEILNVIKIIVKYLDYHC